MSGRNRWMILGATAVVAVGTAGFAARQTAAAAGIEVTVYRSPT